MKNNLPNSIISSLLNSSFIKKKIFSVTLNFLKRNKNDFDYFITEYCKTFPNDINKFSSFHNNGYRHIEIAIDLLKKNKLHTNFHIIDVGGASGIVANMFGSNFPNSIVHSFEPIKHSFELLTENTKKLPNIKAYNYALGSKEDEFDINVATRITSSSLYEINNQISDSYFADNLKLNRNEKIIVKKLDGHFNINEKISLIKLDVQGFELEVLKGGTKTLKQTHFVLTEVMNHDFYNGAPLYFEIDAFLRNNDFELLDIIPSIRRNDKLMEWDIIYYNKKLHTV